MDKYKTIVTQIHDIAKSVGTSVSQWLSFWSVFWNNEVIARQIPYILTNDQQTVRVRIAKHLKQFENIVSGDESHVHYFEPIRKTEKLNITILTP